MRISRGTPSTRGVLAALAVTLSLGTAAAQAETLVVDTNFQLKTADPARQFEPTANLFMHAIYQNLVTFDGGDLTKVVPSIASLPVISDDSKTFTFTVNPDATFADGTPVTVEDVVFSLQRVANVKGTPSFLMAGVSVAAGEEEGTVVLTTEESDPGLPYKLTNPALAILNADLLMENGGSASEDASTEDTADAFLATTSAGSGPYVLDKYDMASEIVLKRNDEYWGETPDFDTIVIRNVDTSAQQMNISRGASQIALDVPPDMVSSLGDNVNVEQTAGADVGFLFTNSNPEISEITANPDFKEAVRYAIDYDGILNLVGAGAQRPGSVVPSMFAGALPASEGPSQDVEKAKEALERSGIENPVVELGYASDLTKNGVSFSDIAAKLQQDLLAVGIETELKPEPISAILDVYRAGTMQMSIQWWGPDFPDPSNYLLFNPGALVGLRAGWAEGAAPDVIEAADAAAAAIDPDERAPLYETWQKAMNAEGPFIGLFQPAVTVATSNTIEPLPYNPMWTVDLGAAELAE
ncbi:ABC transporter substrate-binding protein [Devosia sp.]|uniref:ABC transporter substrate-binding protein n=1 Tax=Devosia sp. TaxID=1871048 RepID=UPI003A8E8E41